MDGHPQWVPVLYLEPLGRLRILALHSAWQILSLLPDLPHFLPHPHRH